MTQDILLWAVLAWSLIISLGLLALAWRAMTTAHDLAKLALQGGALPHQAPVVPIPPAKPPAPAPTPTPTPVPSDAVIDQGLVDFIKKQEGYSAKAYWDYKQYTIGYGTRASGPSEVIDQVEAERRLRQEIANADKLVTDFAPNLPKGVHQALLDLTYNAGPGWEKQSLGAAVKAGKWDTAKADILQYNHAGGKVLDALTRRREAEVSWFDKPL